MSPCPDTPSGIAAHCAEASQIIQPVAYVEPSSSELSGGELSFVVKDSKYTSNAQRNGMIDVAANALYNALVFNSTNPSASKNCINKKWEQGCTSSGKMRSMRVKREEGTRTGGDVAPESDCKHGEQVICTGPDNILVIVIDNTGGMVANLVRSFDQFLPNQYRYRDWVLSFHFFHSLLWGVEQVALLSNTIEWRSHC